MAGGGARDVRRRDRQREKDERWWKTSVMKWNKLSVGGMCVHCHLCTCFVCVCVCEPSSLGVLRVCLFSQARLYSCSSLTAIALSLSVSHTHSLSVLFVCLSSSLLSLYPSILSHQGLLSGGPICRSSSGNLIGDRLSLAWHGDELPNPFSPPARGSLCSALVQRRSLTQRLQPQRLQPQRRPRLRPRIQRSVCDDLRKKKKSNAPNARCPDGFKSCSSHLMLFRQT